ncbi:MAG: hypothetical protein UX13_C0031G0008 [Candidatus Woesebacteria bacterium GW2011_GWB1_45_5]|uniref:Uncharacterized protein n=1 Tax=Candidatus Woesebacteria bacterium GW2011_GWB1_45_5 TaxID=1618581 RepID=A0A0G1MNL2_9BACT|nr:MAG: hypothetical protein UX13_C0031G0008 [Candidatus Woesebacteria bacterium GW2011_GWB1_45_5]
MQTSKSGYLLPIWVIPAFLITLIVCLGLAGLFGYTTTPDGTRFHLYEGREYRNHYYKMCPSNTWVWMEGSGEFACQPENKDEDGAVTLYATFRFGEGSEYATALDAAKAAFSSLGNRPASLYCGPDGKFIQGSTLENFLADTNLQNYCPDIPGYIEIWPVQ